MNIPTFINEYGFETAIKPWHRPEIVYTPREELPDMVSYLPTSYPEICCCESFTGFSGAYYAGPLPAVPEPSAYLLVAAGILTILFMKWRKK